MKIQDLHVHVSPHWAHFTGLHSSLSSRYFPALAFIPAKKISLSKDVGSKVFTNFCNIQLSFSSESSKNETAAFSITLMNSTLASVRLFGRHGLNLGMLILACRASRFVAVAQPSSSIAAPTEGLEDRKKAWAAKFHCKLSTTTSSIYSATKKRGFVTTKAAFSVMVENKSKTLLE